MVKRDKDNLLELKRQWEGSDSLFDQVPCLITVHDKNYRLIKYNKEFAQKFDPKPNSFCYTAYKGRDEKCVFCPVEKTFQDGKSHRSEETGVNKDGTVFHWITRTSPIKDANGEIVAALEMNLDISLSKELQEKLEQSEQKYHAIFNNIPNPVFVLDYYTFSIIDCNRSVANVYGFTRDEMINNSFLDLFQDEDKEDLESKLRSSDFFTKVKQLHKDRRSIYVNIRISPSEYSAKKVLLVTTSDITRPLETEQQLIQAGKMATLGEMASGVAHELNQPLSVIKTTTSFFLKKIKKKEQIDEHILSEMLIKVDKNVDRASNIVNHMRQFARKSEMALKEVDVNKVIQNAVQMFKQQLKARGIQLNFNMVPNLPRVMADYGQLEQVFVNLIVNSRDAIEKKWQDSGEISETDSITITSKSDENFVIIEILDTGTGIPKNIMEKLFEPFFTTKEVGKGTGLGLSISYGIIRECRGTIEATSTPGEGTCFIIRLPIKG